jgi:L-ornithine N5-oxygenase
VDLIMRARAIKPSDNSPFVNEIFNADFVDHVYSRPRDERGALLREFWHTNYASPDLELIEQIFKVFYEQRVSGEARHRFLRRHEIQSVRASADGIHLNLLDVNAARESSTRYDAVVLATGYAREQHKALLSKLSPYLGSFEADRNYRIRSTRELLPAVFLQGACETSHGLSDTLLSVTAVRSDEIGQALLSARSPRTAASVGDATTAVTVS